MNFAYESTTWLTRVFADVLKKQIPLAKTTRLEEWVRVLASHDTDSVTDLESMPALKILAFFQGLVQYEKRNKATELRFVTNNAATASKTMAHLPSIGEIWSKQSSKP